MWQKQVHHKLSDPQSYSCLASSYSSRVTAATKTSWRRPTPHFLNQDSIQELPSPKPGH